MAFLVGTVALRVPTQNRKETVDLRLAAAAENAEQEDEQVDEVKVEA